MELGRYQQAYARRGLIIITIDDRNFAPGVQLTMSRPTSSIYRSAIRPKIWSETWDIAVKLVVFYRRLENILHDAP